MSNDIGAIGLIDACEAIGLRVPADMSVVGFDDITIAGLKRISLTTVSQPLMFQAERGVSLLLERISTRRLRPATFACRRAARARFDGPAATGQIEGPHRTQNRVTTRRRYLRGRRPAAPVAPVCRRRTRRTDILITRGTASPRPEMPSEPTIRIVATALTAGVMPNLICV